MMKEEEESFINGNGHISKNEDEEAQGFANSFPAALKHRRLNFMSFFFIFTLGVSAGIGICSLASIYHQQHKVDTSSTSATTDSGVSVHVNQQHELPAIETTSTLKSPTLSPIHSWTKEPTLLPTISPSMNQLTQTQDAKLFPPSINVCNVESLSFNTSKMIFKGQYMGYIPSNGTNYAYGPFITCQKYTSIYSR